MKDQLRGRSKAFGLGETPMALVRAEVKVHNHLPNNFIIGNKKALFQAMSEYYSKQEKQVFDFLPVTFHIKSGLEDEQYLRFLQHYYALSKAGKLDPEHSSRHNAWIVKPGENTNRGKGIMVCL
jgi:hypothetical protein